MGRFYVLFLLKSNVIVQMMTVDKDNFRVKLLGYLNQYLCDIQDSDGNWTVKGFIDIFKKHYVLGIVYKKQDELSVIKDIEFILQEKYKIAIDRPWNSGSKDIASTTKIDELREGSGVLQITAWMYSMIIGCII